MIYHVSHHSVRERVCVWEECKCGECASGWLSECIVSEWVNRWVSQFGSERHGEELGINCDMTHFIYWKMMMMMMRRLHIIDWMMHDRSHTNTHTTLSLLLSVFNKIVFIVFVCVWNLMSSSELTLCICLFFFGQCCVLIQYETSKKVGDKVVDFTVYDTSGNEKYTALAEEHMQSMYWITTTTREDSKMSLRCCCCC